MKQVKIDCILEGIQLKAGTCGIWFVLFEQTFFQILFGPSNGGDQKIGNNLNFLIGRGPVRGGTLHKFFYKSIWDPHLESAELIYQYLLRNDNMGDVPPDVVSKAVGYLQQIRFWGLC